MTTLEKITPNFIEALLKKWQKGDFSAEDLATLGLLPTALQTLEQQQLSLRDLLFERVQANLPDPFLKVVASQNQEQVLSEFKKLFGRSPSNALYFALIHCRYFCFKKYTIKDLAKNVGVSERTLRRYLLEGFDLLSIQLRTEMQSKADSRLKNSIREYFPNLAERQVVGVKGILEELNAWLKEKDSHYAISIEGMGGIGKTLIAKHLLEEQYKKGNFIDYAWISARQKGLSSTGEIDTVSDFASSLDDVVARLTHTLGQSHLAGFSTEDKLQGLYDLTARKPYLFIIDNLETIEDVDKLVPKLLQLARPSKIIFTSRKSLSKFTELHTFSTPALSSDNSKKLIRSEIKRRGLRLPLSEESISELYEVVGGIPLVLKLAAAQLGRIPTKDIIGSLRSGKENAQGLYNYIYRQAWSLLTDTAKELLLSMLLVSPDGEDRHWICEMSGLSNQQFSEGLAELEHLSLIEFSGTLEMPLYRIHRLTTTFLESDILQGWES